MNIRQAVKMAWKSIIGKKGRSMLTMLGVIIGIAAVMTIVSVMSGYAAKTMEQFSAMGSNKVTVEIYNYFYEVDENGNMVSSGRDYFPDLYDYCKSIPQYVVGVTPEAYASVNVVYGTKNSANFQWDWDERGNMTGQYPPQVYYVSDQYSACNNLIVAKGRDLGELDVERYNQVCVMGSQAAEAFFDSADPVGKVLQLNGQNFEVVGVYDPRITGSDAQGSTIDNFILIPYTARRLLGGENISSFIVKAREGVSTTEVATRIRGFLKGLVDSSTGDSYVSPDDRWQQSMNEQMGMISLVLGGIAAISLLVGGIGIMNIMLVTVTERTREIGIRRAIGAQRSSIVTQFLIEAAMLCGIGGIIGILIGTLGCYTAGNLLFHMTIYPSAGVTAGALGFSVLLGLIFGCYPAVKASKLQPVEALRAE
ncbi:ABC transporter permease [uncultured Oscillibacter sp.]|uniref:ABC transporter permease n=1 Tax=uncultured Oscillibacter sp. TaxID=876091 RepID=UPI0025F9A1D3|nr:ABC transporter permease [uncultured Oscillibacter sp.]